MAKRMSHRYPEQMERGFKGVPGVKGRTSGSPVHLGETHGPGPVPGAGQIGDLGAPNSGTNKETRATMGAEAFPSRKTPGAPSGIKTYASGE